MFPRCFLILCVLFLLLQYSKGESVEGSEEQIDGLEEFLTNLDPNTSDIILELLEVRNHPKKERLMRRIMRKLSQPQLDKLFEIYMRTRE
ncbi:unnamed protein product [Caenorhabditis angaria]|uniref:SXP/RAL-2 family protein Ani s 5-like cation-binding domain-containing protein n=1 Tax=Caenorhabditis angaria TaxID=860376 RepID=A0A9P1J0G2_9PELO|nr:unnamed protein product [Caenorhabditis angaria]